MASAVQLLKRWEDLRSARAPTDALVQDITDYLLPYKSNVNRVRTPGEKQTELVYDSTGIQALLLLASRMHGTVTPSTQPWISLMMRDDELNEVKAVKVWLEDCAVRMHKALRQSTFTLHSHEFYIDLVGPGTGVLFVEERPLRADGRFAGLRFLVPQFGSYVIAEDFDGTADTLFYEFKLSARAAVAKVRNTRRAEALAPMSPYERRVVHMELASYSDVITESIGQEPQRRIVVKPL